jgi:hypothetical protein
MRPTFYFSLFTFLFCLGALIEPPVAYSQIRVTPVQVENEQMVYHLSFGSTPEGSIDFQVLDQTGKPIEHRVELLPVRLWMMIDHASQCSSTKLVSYLNRFLPTLKSRLHPDSLISIGTFSSSQKKIHLSDVKAGHLKNHPFQCDSQALSSSYGPLLKLMSEKKEIDSLPKLIWVFSSGNVSLDSEEITLLKSLNSPVSIYLYNSFLIDQANLIVSQLSQSLGEEKIALTPIEPETQGNTIPQLLFQLKINPPLNLAGNSQLFKVIASQNGKEIAQSSFIAEVPNRSQYPWTQRYFLFLIIGIGFVSLIGIFIFLRRFYQPLTCPECHRSVRRAQQFCLFCRKSGDAFLIEKTRLLREKICLIQNKIQDIGWHSDSPFKILRLKSEACLPVVRIEEIQLDPQTKVYRLKRLDSQSKIRVAVNECSVSDERYLKSGDRIRLRNCQLIFYFWN